MWTKICGATGDSDIGLLTDLGVELIGLWHGVTGGHAELAPSDLARLAALTTARGATPVLVTFIRDAAVLRTVTSASGVRWVQLHGYQPPALVAALKAEGLTVVKVLHLRGGDCVERPLISSYERAGTDLFLLDSVAADGRVGSTGLPPAPDASRALAGRLSRPFLLAGGVQPETRDRYRELTALPGFAGIDVDSGARGPDGAFSAERVIALREAWGAEGVTS
jgi:phosphoribosylanthranilate isomerase